MHINENLIARMLQARPVNIPEARWLAECFNDIEGTRRRMRELNDKWDEEAKRREAYDASHDQQRRNIQSTCRHWSTTYHYDAAGGSDSYTDCDLCGAIVK